MERRSRWAVLGPTATPLRRWESPLPRRPARPRPPPAPQLLPVPLLPVPLLPVPLLPGRRGLRCRGLGTLGGLRSLGSLGPFGIFAFGDVVGPDVVAVLVVGVLAVEILVLGRDRAALGGLLDRQRDAPALEVEVDDLDPQLLARRDHLVRQVDVVGGHLGDVDETLDALTDLDEGAERHQLRDPAVDQLADLVAAGELLPGVLLGGLEGERDPLPGEVDVEDLNGHLVTHLDHGARVVDVLPRQLGHVDEPVHPAKVDEGPEVHHGADDAAADLAGLEVGQELVAGLPLGLFQVGPAGQHDVVAVLVQLDDLGLEGPPDVGLEVTHPAQLDQRGGQEAPQPDVEDQAALDDLDDRAFDDSVGLLDLLDRAPGPLVLGPLLGQDEPALLVLLLEDKGLDHVAGGHDLVGVHVVADGELAVGDDPFRLVADVEEDLVLVDLDHGAGDDVALVELDDGPRDGVGEGHAAEVVAHHLQGLVLAVGIGATEGAAGGRGRLCGRGRGFGGVHWVNRTARRGGNRSG